MPFLYGIFIAFTEWNLFTDPTWVGLENFKAILFDQDSSFYRQFWQSLGNTFIFVIMTVPLCIIVPLALAGLLGQKPKGKTLFGSIFYIPTLFSVSAVMIIFNFLLSVSYGPFNDWFNTKFNLLANQPSAWISLVLVTVWWSVGGNLIIYEAAISNISEDLLDAAAIDGAGKFRTFFSVILPNMRFQLLFTTITTIIAQFNVYGQPLMLTGGGPNQSTTVLIMIVQRLAFGTGYSRAGIASAMAVMLGLILLVISGIQFALMRRNDD